MDSRLRRSAFRPVPRASVDAARLDCPSLRDVCWTTTPSSVGPFFSVPSPALQPDTKKVASLLWVGEPTFSYLDWVGARGWTRGSAARPFGPHYACLSALRASV